MKNALYAGSFDPPTNGHIDVIRRAAALFDEVIVGIASNAEKTPMFSVAERIALLKPLASPRGNVKVEAFDMLAVEFAKSRRCTVLLRGIRTLTDFEYEHAMAVANRQIGGIETLFMPSSPEFAFLSSRLIKEAEKFGGDVAGFIPENVAKAFSARKKPGKKSGRAE